MSRDQAEDSTPIESRDQLVAYFETGCKRREERGVGTEHEAFGIWRDTLAPVTYEGDRGLGALFRGFCEGGPWTPQYDRDNIMALVGGDGSAITLEPGGQLELSGRVTRSIHETADELTAYLDELTRLSQPLGIAWQCLGYHPLTAVDDIPWMPKSRYDLMAPFLLSRGQLAHHMMKATCTVQANFDYLDEADWADMVHLGARISPIVSALFANSSLRAGRPNGYQTFRCHVWTRTDPDRCGTPAFMLQGPPTFDQYVDYLLDIPMMFITRAGRYVDVGQVSFRQFVEAGHGGHRATLGDWALHVSTAFPDIRTKRFVEVRGADGGDFDQVLAVPALWKGIFYDDEARRAADELVEPMSPTEHGGLYESICRLALNASWRGRPVLELARELTEIAVAGLDRQWRAATLAGGDDESVPSRSIGAGTDHAASESIYLAPVRARLARGETPADELLEAWQAADSDPRMLLEVLLCR